MQYTQYNIWDYGGCSVLKHTALYCTQKLHHTVLKHSTLYSSTGTPHCTQVQNTELNIQCTVLLMSPKRAQQ